MTTYKGIVVQRTYQTIMIEVDDSENYDMEDIERMIMSEFDVLENNSESEIEVYDIEKV